MEPARASDTAAVPWIDGSGFEGMYQRALKPTGAFADELRKAGYDVKNPVGRYHAQVWHDTLEVARRHTYPTLPLNDGFRQLGRRFLDSYFETILGKTVAVVLPILGAERTAKQLPKLFSRARTQLDMQIAQEAPRRWLLHTRDPYSQADFVAGILEAGMTRTGVVPVVEVVHRGHAEHKVRISW